MTFSKAAYTACPDVWEGQIVDPLMPQTFGDKHTQQFLSDDIDSYDG